jgi:hypothetical protein
MGPSRRHGKPRGSGRNRVIPRLPFLAFIQEKCGQNRLFEAETRQKPKKIGQFPAKSQENCGNWVFFH